MLSKVLIAWGLLALCVTIHAGGVAAALRWLPDRPLGGERFLRSTWLFIRIAGWMVLLHVLEVSAWALVYHRGSAIPGLQASFYFSVVTYTTTGYGDLLLPPEWQLVGGIEAMTGILMFGWSTGFFFAAVSRMYEARPR